METPGLGPFVRRDDEVWATERLNNEDLRRRWDASVDAIRG